MSEISPEHLDDEEENAPSLSETEAAQLSALVRQEVGEAEWRALKRLSWMAAVLNGLVALALVLGVIVLIKLALWVLAVAGFSLFGAPPSTAYVRPVLIFIGLAIILIIGGEIALTPVLRAIDRRLEPLTMKGLEATQLRLALMPRWVWQRPKTDSDIAAIEADPNLAQWIRLRQVLLYCVVILFGISLVFGIIHLGYSSEKDGWAWRLLDPDDQLIRWFWKIVLGGLLPVATVWLSVHLYIRRRTTRLMPPSSAKQ